MKLYLDQMFRMDLATELRSQKHEVLCAISVEIDLAKNGAFGTMVVIGSGGVLCPKEPSGALS